MTCVKKMLVLFLALVMVVTPAFAAELDLTSMSVEELYSLRSKISTELNARLIPDSSTLFGGVYVVGKDIKAGKYAFYPESISSVYVTIDIYVSEEAFENDELLRANRHTASESEAEYLDLQDGMVVSVFHGYGLLQPIQPSWAP